jgi:hypothetical protein
MVQGHDLLCVPARTGKVCTEGLIAGVWEFGLVFVLRYWFGAGGCRSSDRKVCDSHDKNQYPQCVVDGVFHGGLGGLDSVG